MKLAQAGMRILLSREKVSAGVYGAPFTDFVVAVD
jgi:hypothetical protein